jgi:uncharacterized protein
VILCDINLLLYATIPTFPAHARAQRWLAELLSGPSPQLALCHVVTFGFIRICTNRHVFRQPRTIDEALADVRSWLDAGAAMLSPGPRHLELAFNLMHQLGTAGNLTTDVQVAALAIEHQVELHSADADFARFPGLRWRDPLTPGGSPL